MKQKFFKYVSTNELIITELTNIKHCILTAEAYFKRTLEKFERLFRFLKTP